MTHSLKTYPDPFQAIWDGRKKFEYRKNDRDYQLGDCLFLMEYNPETDGYSNRSITADVTYILHGGQFGIPEGYCIMSFDDIICEDVSDLEI